MKLSERIRRNKHIVHEFGLQKEWADEVAQLEEDFTSTMRSLAKRNQAYIQLKEETAALKRDNETLKHGIQFIRNSFGTATKIRTINLQRMIDALLTDTQEVDDEATD